MERGIGYLFASNRPGHQKKQRASEAGGMREGGGASCAAADRVDRDGMKISFRACKWVLTKKIPCKTVGSQPGIKTEPEEPEKTEPEYLKTELPNYILGSKF
jgi:hypothetical protein